MALKKCSECGREISTRAAACPGCGAPQAAGQTPQVVAQPKRKTSLLTKIIGYPIAAAVLLSIVIGAMSGGGSGSSQQSSGSAAATQATPAKPAPDPAKQAKRKELIGKLQQQGLFGDVQCRGAGGDVIVEPLFYTLDFKEKASFVGVVYGFCFGDSAQYEGLNLKDSKTNKEVGTFSAAFGLKME